MSAQFFLVCEELEEKNRNAFKEKAIDVIDSALLREAI